MQRTFSGSPKISPSPTSKKVFANPVPSFGPSQSGAPSQLQMRNYLHFSKLSPPKCPHLVTLQDVQDPEILLPILQLKLAVEIHIAVAAIRIEVTFANVLPSVKSCIFQMPCSDGAATVTSSTMLIGERRYETIVVAPNAKLPTQNDGLTKLAQQFSGGDLSRYDPDMFRLPLPNVPPGQNVTVSIDYLQELHFSSIGEYCISVPITIPSEMMGAPLHQILEISSVINTGTPDARWGSSSHDMQVLYSDPFRTVLQRNRSTPNLANRDYELSYFALGEMIKGSCIADALPDSYGEGAFCLMLSPPELNHISEFFGRNIVFLLDHSGSMHGAPIVSARNALATGLSLLGQNDFFAICAFDDHQIWFGSEGKPVLFQASLQNIASAQQWVQSIEACGLTDIQTPLVQANSLLFSRFDEEKSAFVVPRLPIAFLITDGAVENEKEICKWASAEAKEMRIFTFAIGGFANRYFLRMLSQIGRGHSDVSLNPETLQAKMEGLMQRTKAPVLSHITIDLQSVKKCSLYPFPMPDLFVGAPLIVTGQFEGQLPSQIVVRGLLSNGQLTEYIIPVFSKEQIPVKKIAAKMQLEYMIAQYWLSSEREQKDLKNKIVMTSVQQSIPCAMTNTVAYEVAPTRIASQHKQKKHKEGGFPAGAAVGGVVLVGAAIGLGFAFGSVAATVANADVLSSFAEVGNFFGNLDLGSVDPNCCDCLSNLSCFGIGDGSCNCGEGCFNGYNPSDMCSCFDGCDPSAFCNLSEMCSCFDGCDLSEQLNWCFSNGSEACNSCCSALFGMLDGL